MRLIMREQVLEDNILILEEENIIYLNKLRITCPDAYARKLKILQTMTPWLGDDMGGPVIF